MPITLVLSVAFLVTLVLCYVLRPIAQSVGLMDRPGGRKKHARETPLIGGIAIALGIAVAMTMVWSELSGYQAVLLLSLYVLVYGVIDDRLDLTPRLRMLLHISAGLLLVYGVGISIQSVALVSNSVSIQLGLLSMPFTVFAVCAAVNAYNMFDGVDGLAGSMSSIPLGMLALSAWVSGATEFATVSLLFLAVIMAFLCVNLRLFKRQAALAFLGDGGSTLLGFVVCWALIVASQGADPIVSPMLALWFSAVPLIDSAVVISRRIVRKRSPFSGGRDHIHHLLIDNGLTVNTTVLMLVMTGVVIASVGWAGHRAGVSDVWLFFAFLLMLPIHYALTLNLERAVGTTLHPFIARIARPLAVTAPQPYADNKAPSLEKAA